MKKLQNRAQMREQYSKDARTRALEDAITEGAATQKENEGKIRELTVSVSLRIFL